MRRSIFGFIIFLLVVAAIAVAIYMVTRPSQQVALDPANLSAQVGKPKPVADYFEGCPPSGSGGDPVLNTLKNRIDEGEWASTTISSLLSLDWPATVENQPRSRWSRTEREAVARYEGSPVQVEGYLLSAKRMSPETTNCRSVDYVDFHLWLADDPNKDRAESLVIETTPRVMSAHSEWTLRRLSELARERTRVRISGWLMLDPEHPDQLGKTRGSIWEIHPVMQIETQFLDRWEPLDTGTTGVRSASQAPQTAPPVTPAETATQPPASDEETQDNRSIRISNIFYDGAGRNEPDEYVEITNTGNELVDITDWELQDVSGSREYRWEQYTLLPGATIRVYTNESRPASGGFSFNSGRALWGNSGDIAELYDSDKQLVSRYAYGDKK